MLTLHHGLHNNADYNTRSSIAIRVNGQNRPDGGRRCAIRDCAKYFTRIFFFLPPACYTQRTYYAYVRDSGDRYSDGGGESEGRADMDTCTPLTVHACILREAVGVRAVVRGESRRVVVRASRDTQPPPSLAKSPAKSLLLITRQREHHHGQGILLFIMM